MTAAHEKRMDVDSADRRKLTALLDAQLSTGARLGHVALLLAALTMLIVAGSLWLSEPGLPARTRAAFALIMGVAGAWCAYALWVLTSRRPLLAAHRVVAGRMAVAFSAIFVAGAGALGYVTDSRAPYAAAALGLAMLGAAAAILVRARRVHAALVARRAALERELSMTPRARTAAQ